MMNVEDVMDYVEKKVDCFKKYCKVNKSDLVQKGLLIASGTVIGVMGYRYNGMKSVLNDALNANDSLAKRVTELEDTNVQLLTLYRQGISDGLRNGSPVCGQHMRNLQKIIMNQDF